MTFEEVRIAAKACTGELCKVCPVCNGRACRNVIPGPGAMGDIAVRNYDAWQAVHTNMDTICAGGEPELSLDLFGQHFAYPFFAGPVGAVQMHYGPAYNDESYNDVLVAGCREAGICAFTGDGFIPETMISACRSIRASDGIGIPTIKPWDMVTVGEKLALTHESGAFAVAMDIDAAGLPFLRGKTPPAGSKTPEELAEIVKAAGVPFIVKGIMTVRGAEKARDAGAAGIVVSNHGGRVLAGTPATAEVLPEIADALRGSGVTILVDGGIRSGTDIFRALALGADATVLARPFVTAVYGGGREGIKALCQKLSDELAATMRMCGAHTLAEITRDMVRV